jgi:PKD repeat protein
MKKILVLFLALSVFVSCKKDKVEPVIAGFSYKELEDGQVQFFNESKEATTYAWDFGNGQGSEEPLPTHKFAANGDYDVTLVAKGPNGQNTITQKVTVTTIKEYEGQWQGTGQLTILNSGMGAEGRDFSIEIVKLPEISEFQKPYKVTIKEFKNNTLSDQFDFRNCNLIMQNKQLSIFEETLTMDRQVRRCDGSIDIVNGKLVAEFTTKTQYVEIRYSMVLEKK